MERHSRRLPVFLNLVQIRFPIGAIASIAHRVHLLQTGAGGEVGARGAAELRQQTQRLLRGKTGNQKHDHRCSPSQDSPLNCDEAKLECNDVFSDPQHAAHPPLQQCD